MTEPAKLRDPSAPKKRYRIACDDADPESCPYIAEGWSVDEVYGLMVEHGKTVHPEKKPNFLDPERLEKEMREFIEELQRRGEI